MMANYVKRIGVLMGMVASWGCASAQSEAPIYPYYLGASQVITHDSYMQRYGGNGGDWISSTGIRAGVDQAFGRQQLVATFGANRNRYRRNDVLNNNDYALNAQLNWATLERFSGLLAAQSSESLYKNTLTTQVLGRNLLRSNGLTFRAQVGLVTVWSFDVGVSTSKQRTSNSSQVFQFLNQDQTVWSAGTRWSPTPDLSVRLGARHTNGSLPSLGSDFTRNDIDLSSEVALTGVSQLNARLSSTQVKYSLPGYTNQSGWTGLLGWNWQPTGKLKFALLASRDNLLGSVDQRGAVVTANSNSTRLSNTLALTSDWEITSKLQLNSSVSYLSRTFDSTSSALIGGSTLSANTANGKDSITSLSLGLRYLPLRNLELGCGFTVDDHRLSGNSQVISVPAYNARVYNCYGQAFLR